MKALKVYLQYPWKFPDSPYYKLLIENPPKGIQYLNTEKQKGVITQRNKLVFSNRLKGIIRRTLDSTNLTIPNAHLTKSKENYDLIHCAHCLSRNKDRPWVTDFESEWQMYVGKKTKSAKKKVRKILGNKNCKKIMPWTECTKEEILKEFPEIKEKIEVVYPAVPLRIGKKKQGKRVTILYATRYFWLKGGFLALKVLSRIKKKYKNVEVIFISDAPEEAKGDFPEIKIKDLVPQTKLFEYYKKADIFFYPSFADNFGFGLLEAMSFGLPIVSVITNRTSTRKEIIENRKTGILVEIKNQIRTKEDFRRFNHDKKIEDNLFSALEKLIENKKLREKMSMNCIKTIKGGKFSVKERGKKLKRIYEEAVKS